VHYGLGLVGVWIAYTLDEWVRGVIMVARWHSLGWVKSARASRRRAARGAAAAFPPPNDSEAALADVHGWTSAAEGRMPGAAAPDRVPWEETR
jgi:hypothetical protein